MLWGPYQDFGQLVREDPRCSTVNPMFGAIEQPGIGTLLAPRSPLAFSASGTPDPLPAPTLGADTASVLQSLVASNKE